ncbi:MAG: sulfatase-like hydrolase/transferase, partial [Gammaproteobacteria bacterium]|nr:sulfatase-like hydrolase/transferase [Gammaproteobacteria bacterium]
MMANLLRAGSALVLALVMSSAWGAKQPNIMVIWGDDIGITNISAYSDGIMGYKTPNIDRIANEGMRFTQGYAACQVCSPSRASILTGKVTPRHGITDWIGARSGAAWRETGRFNKLLPPEYEHGLRSDEVTFAEVLRRAGSRTVYAGKW